MKHLSHILVLGFLLFFKTSILFSQNQIFDQIYKDNIASVLLYQQNIDVGIPVIELNSNQRLVLCFDDLDSDVKDYSYEVYYCNWDWSRSNLSEIHYRTGFIQDEIRDFRFSFNTVVPYTHYSLIFPNDNMNVRLSGNYIIRVFENFNRENIVFEKRFMVVENIAAITGRVSIGTQTQDRIRKQELHYNIDFSKITQSLNIQDFRVVEMQNNRWDNANYNRQHNFIRGSMLEFGPGLDIAFQAGNEYRFFDLRSLRGRPDRFLSLERANTQINGLLRPDESRKHKQYVNQPDLNGGFVIFNEDVGKAENEADYVFVTFTLRSDNLDALGDVYLIGAFTDNYLNPKYKLTYNRDLGAYQLRTLLKQGFYNYKYGFKRNDEPLVDIDFFEGSFRETENSYTIMVYYRDPMLRNDRLVAITTLNSRDNR